MTIFRHESFCGSCEQDECPEVPSCARREDSRFLLHCEHCPAAYHYCCAGYYDSQDGPESKDRWVCWRCAHDAPGGFKWNWVVPSVAASPGSVVYVAEEAGTTVFHPASVLSSHATYMVVQFQTSPGQEPRTENIARESSRVWHGSVSSLVWEEAPAQNPTAFVPKSRKYCPPSFKKIAEQHGVPIPAHLAEPTPLVDARNFTSQQQPRQPGGDAGLSEGANRTVGTRNAARAGPSSAVDPSSAEDARNLAGKGRDWLDAVREFGESVKDKVLIHMPEFMALRRDLFVHSYAVWLVVMSWGGEEVVCENKLWSALAGVFDAPQTMTNRAQKMKQVWTQFRLARITQRDAQSFSAALEVPGIDGDLLFSKSHPVLRQWPDCKRTKLPEGGPVGRASNRGTSMAGGTGASAGRNGCAAGRGAPRGRGRGRGGGGGGRGRKRLRSASDSDHDRSVEAESSPEPFEEEEEVPEPCDSEPNGAPSSPRADARGSAKKRKGSQPSAHGGKQSKGGRSRTDSGQTELSEDDDDVGGGRRGGQRAASPPQQQQTEEAEDLDAGTVLVAEGASRLRRMPMSALPPKLPPGLDLPDGAISSEFARRLRLGDYMIRLDSSCIHTSLKPREKALELARTALRRDSPKIQFVSTEKDFLGGWWDATLRGARTGSVLEGGARFLVEENYPGDPDDPYPQTWVPLLYYGPQPYPFQTPQVMLRETPEWKPAASKEQAMKVALGELVEAVDVPEEQEDTVFWRGCVHELKPDGQVVVRLLAAPYGNAGVSTDPEAEESNYQSHPPERVRRAPVDDLMGMVREPSDDPEKGEIRAVATTDQMELQVLQHTRLVVGRYAGGKAVVAIEAHATFKTAQAAHPDDPELAKVIKNRKPSTAGTSKRSVSAAISAAYKARKSGKAPRRTARQRPSDAAPNGAQIEAQNGAQHGAPNGARSAAGHPGLLPAQQVSGGAMEGPYAMLDAHMSGAGAAPSPMHSHRSLSSDGWQHRNSVEMQQMGMMRQHSNHDGRVSESAALDHYRSAGNILGHSAMQAASPRNPGSFPGAPVYTDALPRFAGGMPAQPAGFFAQQQDSSNWELNALAQMTAPHGTGVQYGGMPCPQQLVNGGHVQRYVNAHGGNGMESLPQWGGSHPGQHAQHMMPGQGMFPGTRGPHG